MTQTLQKLYTKAIAQEAQVKALIDGTQMSLNKLHDDAEVWDGIIFMLLMQDPSLDPDRYRQMLEEAEAEAAAGDLSERSDVPVDPASATEDGVRLASFDQLMNQHTSPTSGPGPQAPPAV